MDQNTSQLDLLLGSEHQSLGLTLLLWDLMMGPLLLLEVQHWKIKKGLHAYAQIQQVVP